MAHSVKSSLLVIVNVSDIQDGFDPDCSASMNCWLFLRVRYHGCDALCFGLTLGVVVVLVE